MNNKKSPAKKVAAKTPLKDLSSKRSDRVKGGIGIHISTNSTSLLSVSPTTYKIKPR